MPPRRMDEETRRMLAEIEILELTDGKTILKKGTRRSVGNDPAARPESMDHLLGMWQINNLDRKKKKTRRERLKGLFGGGE